MQDTLIKKRTENKRAQNSGSHAWLFTRSNYTVGQPF